MPIKSCQSDGKPGFRWGNTTKCWTYTPGDEASKKEAKRNCIRQAIRIEGPEKFKQIMQSEGSQADILDILRESDDNDGMEDIVGIAETIYFTNFWERIVASDIIKEVKQRGKK